MCFFFQAEDGIRELVRSRGLGDVYKRQVVQLNGLLADARNSLKKVDAVLVEAQAIGANTRAVSYTHLTLPTSDLV